MYLLLTMLAAHQTIPLLFPAVLIVLSGYLCNTVSIFEATVLFSFELHE
jgi:hypothetical protein